MKPSRRAAAASRSSRAGFASAERALGALRGSAIALEDVTLVDLERAMAIGEIWADPSFDLVDRTSMAVMERLGFPRRDVRP